ncbi:VOC family protein [Cytobacillus purgationiresistens]|uniref:VOC domain-containing protein n=1 Tax=Cytobacillus purgationiresistens TaxID=863449 RepID=A0ABU0AH86_9BACI|nr:ring-cleaving dioxygenase [Cytobacillus purgationiresistens]MDQ0270626.1 hypothetical protein [Cytobacillus purgationiresistens]
MKFEIISFQTKQITNMKEFYTQKLNLELMIDEQDRFSVKVGDTELIFKETAAANNPIYHFAINIPHNKMNEAKAWIKKLIDLNIVDGEDEVFFESWNANAIYFTDPAGNIVEFIARHNLNNRIEAPFHSNHLLNISEVGVIASEVIPFAKKMNGLGLGNWRNGNEGLTPIGDEEGLFIIVKNERRWYFSDQLAAFYPVEATIRNFGKICFHRLDDFIFEPFS